MNRKGFTLTELLAVIAIIGIISLIAIPNVVNISDNIKRDNMLNDAKRLISLAKLEVNSDYEKRNFISKEKNASGDDICNSVNSSCKFKIMDLNSNGDFKSDLFTDEDNNTERKIIDVDGLGYENSSYIKYYKDSATNTVKYCAYLVGGKRFLGISTVQRFMECVNEEKCCVNEDELTSKDVVHVK